jgi:hypothetical protein
LIFNQWNFKREQKFTEEEARIAYTFLGYPVLPNAVMLTEKPIKQDVTPIRKVGIQTLLEVNK